MRPMWCFHYLARQNLLDELRRYAPGGQLGVLAINARDLLAQNGKLFLNVRHFRFFFAYYTIVVSSADTLVFPVAVYRPGGREAVSQRCAVGRRGPADGGGTADAFWKSAIPRRLARQAAAAPAALFVMGRGTRV